MPAPDIGPDDSNSAYILRGVDVPLESSLGTVGCRWDTLSRTGESDAFAEVVDGVPSPQLSSGCNATLASVPEALGDLINFPFSYVEAWFGGSNSGGGLSSEPTRPLSHRVRNVSKVDSHRLRQRGMPAQSPMNFRCQPPKKM